MLSRVNAETGAVPGRVHQFQVESKHGDPVCSSRSMKTREHYEPSAQS